MRIAFIGSEVSARIALALAEAGHELTCVLSFAKSPAPAPVSWKQVESRTGVACRQGAVTRETIEAIHRSGPDMILCAGYPRRLDVRPGDPVPAVNFHPSPLPEGRGPAPIPWAILTGRQSTAVTFHEMVERFDAGPIILQRELPLTPGETSASLDSRCRQLGSELAVDLAGRFDELWEARAPQGPASYCRVPRRADRTLDLDGPVEQAGRVLRAFSPGNVFVRVDGRELVVFDAVCWPEAHRFAPGSLVARNSRGRLLAAVDGYVLLRSAMPERLAHLRLALGGVTRTFR